MNLNADVRKMGEAVLAQSLTVMAHGRSLVSQGMEKGLAQGKAALADPRKPLSALVDANRVAIAKGRELPAQLPTLAKSLPAQAREVAGKLAGLAQPVMTAMTAESATAKPAPKAAKSRSTSKSTPSA